ncbi:MAG: hypothetical protein H7Y20_12150, partial [Bryobacteraceae bacterium]|nr:hypothetical protein [Bryobacteraceae bacterium]
SGALGNAEVTGSISGSKLTITFEVSGSKILYEGALEKDGTVKGTVDLGGQAKGTFTGSRNK